MHIFLDLHGPPKCGTSHSRRDVKHTMPEPGFKCECGYFTHRSFNFKRHQQGTTCPQSPNFSKSQSPTPRNGAAKRRNSLSDPFATKKPNMPYSNEKHQLRYLLRPPGDANCMPHPPTVTRDGAQMGIFITPPAPHQNAVQSLVTQTSQLSSTISPPGTPIPSRFYHQERLSGARQVPIEEHERIVDKVRKLEAWQARVKRNVKFLLEDIANEE